MDARTELGRPSHGASLPDDELFIVRAFDVPVALLFRMWEDLDDWLGRYRPFWEDGFDKMDAYLAKLTKGESE